MNTVYSHLPADSREQKGVTPQWLHFNLLILALAHFNTSRATALQISHRDVRESVFPSAPGFTDNRDAYIVGAYALLHDSVVRLTSIPSGVLKDSILPGKESKYASHVDLDKWDSKRLFCFYVTEEVVPVTRVFHNKELELIMLDCSLTPKMRKILEHPVTESYVYVIALPDKDRSTEEGNGDNPWEPVIKATITMGILHTPHVSNLSVRRKLLVCSSALEDRLAPYVLEWVNWQFYNGADHILIYLADASTRIPHILAPYAHSGLISFKHWQLPEIRPNVRMSQQVALVNDCIYSGADQFVWTTSHDLDEYVYVGADSGSLGTMLDYYEKQAHVGAILLKSWVYEANESLWTAGPDSEKPWGIKKRDSSGMSLGVDQELLTIKQCSRRRARPLEGGYFKWFTKTASTESAGVHTVTLEEQLVAEHESEAKLHFKHYFELYNDRPIPCNFQRPQGWCPGPGELDNYPDTSVYDTHGEAYLELWPYNYRGIAKSSDKRFAHLGINGAGGTKQS